MFHVKHQNCHTTRELESFQIQMVARVLPPRFISLLFRSDALTQNKVKKESHENLGWGKRNRSLHAEIYNLI